MIRNIRLAYENLAQINSHEKAPRGAGVIQRSMVYSDGSLLGIQRGFTVSSRQIRTPIGTVEHLAIERIGGGDIPWAVKQEIKDELFGSRSVAIEVYPAKKNLVDIADIYHLWVLPKDYQLPFGIHPTRDPQGSAVQRGYDFNMADVLAWNNSSDRQQVYSR